MEVRSHIPTKMVPYKDGDSMEDCLETFEKVMRSQKVEKDQWGMQLTPLMDGKA